jgi:dolichyl-phosphate-mannose-protein mannosyltransferase
MLHFAPFFLMGRVLYFHHYMPAVLFSSMLSGTCLDFVLRRCVPARIFTPLVVLVIIILGWSFATFRFLSYGMVGPLSTFAAIKWQPEWEIA